MSDRSSPTGKLTPKQQMVIDYMRGNGCVLGVAGWRHLIRRGSFRDQRSLSQVVGALERKGLIECHLPPSPDPRERLTEAGRRGMNLSPTGIPDETDPREVFPEEVVALHDEQGVPWPTWFSGPLFDPTKRDEALAALAEYKAGRGDN